MSEVWQVAAPLIAAMVALIGVYFGSTPRSLRTLETKLRILNALPEDATSRDKLREHVDELVQTEVFNARYSDGVRVAGYFALVVAGAAYSWSRVAKGDPDWWFSAILYTALSVAGVVVGGIALSRRRST